MLPITWQDSAVADLQAIRQQSPHAEQDIQAIRAAATLIPSAPHAAEAGRVPETLEWPVAHTPYRLVYQHKPQEVRILAVLRQRAAA